MNPVLNTLKRWAQLLPVPDGTLREGPLRDAVPGTGGDVVVLCFDKRGRVFQLVDCHIRSSNFRFFPKGRTSVMNMMDELGTEDIPIISVEPD